MGVEDQYRMIDTEATTVQVLGVRVRDVEDQAPDVSYLEQEGWEGRLEEYRRGGFEFRGVYAEAELAIPVGGGAAVLVSIRTSGCWGIESDSDEDHFAEVALEEVATLDVMLAALGVDMQGATVKAALWCGLNRSWVYERWPAQVKG